MIDFTFLHRSLVCATVLAGSLTAVAAEGSIAFAVSDVSAQDATVSVMPSSDELSYYWNFMDKETFLANGGVDKVIENRIAVWERNASYYDNTTWQQMMSYDLQYGPQTNSINDYFGDKLMYSTEYVVYGFGMDTEGNVTAPVSTVEFTTLAPQTSDIAFEIDVTSIVKDKFYYTATAHVEPSNGDRYMVRFYTKDFVDSFDITPGSSGEKRFIADEMLYYPSADDMASGPHAFTYTRCREGESYYVVAMGINDDMTPSTPLTMAEFKAVEAFSPAGSIELEVSDLSPMNGRIRITPSDDTMYYYYNVTTPDVIENKGGIENIPEKLIIDWWKYLAELYGGTTKWQDFIPLQCNQGPLDSTIAHLVEEGDLEDVYWDSDWVLYAVGFDLEGNVVTKSAVLEFSTPDCEKSDLTFDYEFVDAELDSSYPNTSRKYYVVTVDIYPSDDEETYRANYTQMRYYEQWFEYPDANMFDYITQQFLPNSVEFSGPVRLRMPGVPATDALGNLLEWGVFTIGWNEGPTTDLSIYGFNLATSGVESTVAEGVKVKAVNGRLTIEGDFESAVVYALDGSVAGGLVPGHSISVADGIYVVKYVTSDGTQHTQKVMVK